jgi:hypothetical protein
MLCRAGGGDGRLCRAGGGPLPKKGQESRVPHILTTFGCLTTVGIQSAPAFFLRGIPSPYSFSLVYASLTQLFVQPVLNDPIDERQDAPVAVVSPYYL